MRYVLIGFWRIVKYTFITLIVLLALFSVYVVRVSHIDPPKIANEDALRLQRAQLDTNCYVIGNNWFRKSKSGLYELYVEGEPFERGVIYGKLTTELVKRQEDNFTDQIKRLVPSNIYRNFLRYFIGFFNRNLAQNIPE
jgi:hypothetical protein